MYYMKEEWEILRHSEIAPGYLISSHGRISIKGDGFNYPPMEPSYHSTNGYDYHPFVTLKCGIPSLPVLYPIDELVALTFLRIPKELRYGKPVKVVHINGDNRDNRIGNLKWEEEFEEWVDLICPITMQNGEVINPKKGLYRISNFGRIYSSYSNDYMLIYTEPTGRRDNYYKCTLEYEDSSGKLYRKRARLHRLLAFSFRLPGYHKDLQVNHIDGNTTHNHLKNLEFVTNQENARHSIDTMLEINPRGEDHSRSKFTDNQRECIYEIIETLKDIQPSHLTGLIRRRLPVITRTQVKHFKQLLKQTGVEFPNLSDNWKNPQKFTEEEWLELEAKVDEIFDKYGIYQVEVYENEHRKTVQG